MLRIVSLGYGTMESIPVFHYNPGGSVVRAVLIPVTRIPVNCDWCSVGELNKDPSVYAPQCISEGDLIRLASDRWRADSILLDGVEPALHSIRWSTEVRGLTLGVRTQGFASGVDWGTWDYVVFDYFPGGYDSSEVIDKVIATLRSISRQGVHIEVVAYYRSGQAEELNRLGEVLPRDTPIHVIAPDASIWEVRSLYREIGRGFDFVYIHGSSDKRLDTRCPSCGAFIALRRTGLLDRLEISDDSRCPKCGTPIPFGGSISKGTPRLLALETGGDTVWYHPAALPGVGKECA